MQGSCFGRMLKKIVKSIFRKLGYEIHSKRDENCNNALLVARGDDFERLKESCMYYSVIKVHFGCGPRVLKGWINIDLAYEPWHDYLKYYTEKYYPENIRGDQKDFFALDITKKGLPLPDNSVDVIFHEDFLEHLNQRDQFLFLAETFRVLKTGGIHRVNTPNIISSMAKASTFSKGFAGVDTDEWNKWNHLNVLSPKVLEEMADLVGYSKVVFSNRNQSLSRLLPLEYRPDPNDRCENENIFADLIK